MRYILKLNGSESISYTLGYCYVTLNTTNDQISVFKGNEPT